MGQKWTKSSQEDEISWLRESSANEKMAIFTFCVTASAKKLCDVAGDECADSTGVGQAGKADGGLANPDWGLANPVDVEGLFQNGSKDDGS